MDEGVGWRKWRTEVRRYEGKGNDERLPQRRADCVGVEAGRRERQHQQRQLPGPALRDRPLQIQRRRQRSRRDAGATNCAGCPVPLRGTGRYRVKSEFSSNRKGVRRADDADGLNLWGF